MTVNQTCLPDNCSPIREISLEELDKIAGGVGKGWDFSIKASTDTSGKSTVEGTITWHF